MAGQQTKPEKSTTNARNLPVPTPSAVYARMMLFNMPPGQEVTLQQLQQTRGDCTLKRLQQNPSLVPLKRTEDTAEARRPA